MSFPEFLMEFLTQQQRLAPALVKHTIEFSGNKLPDTYKKQFDEALKKTKMSLKDANRVIDAEYYANEMFIKMKESVAENKKTVVFENRCCNTDHCPKLSFCKDFVSQF